MEFFYLLKKAVGFRSPTAFPRPAFGAILPERHRKTGWTMLYWIWEKSLARVSFAGRDKIYIILRMVNPGLGESLL